MTWLVFPASAGGPDGPGTLSDSSRAARVDAEGRLHLSLTKVAGTWRGVQLESLAPLNYGRYRFVTDSVLGNLAKPAVFGMFAYKPSPEHYTDEIDLEISRALGGLGYPRDAQYVVQPFFRPHHIYRYAIRRKYKTVTQQFVWRPGSVRFTTHAGTGHQGRRLGAFSFRGPDVPAPGHNEHLYINLHLHPNRPPGKGARSVILKAYRFQKP